MGGLFFYYGLLFVQVMQSQSHLLRTYGLNSFIGISCFLCSLQIHERTFRKMGCNAMNDIKLSGLRNRRWDFGKFYEWIKDVAVDVEF